MRYAKRIKYCFLKKNSFSFRLYLCTTDEGDDDAPIASYVKLSHYYDYGHDKENKQNQIISKEEKKSL